MVPHPILVTEFEGREEEVLEGRTEIAETGGDLGDRAGWGMILQSLDSFVC